MRGCIRRAVLAAIAVPGVARAAEPATRPAAAAATTQALPRATLVGFAALPADTFGDGPRSGQFIDLAKSTLNGRKPPFDRQPIQGVSDVLPTKPDGTFLALSDNGYGAKANSADFILCAYRVRPAFRTPDGGGDGTVAAEVAFRLRDPDQHVPWPIVAGGKTYPNSNVPVPDEIRAGRLLTGADFDVESIVPDETGDDQTGYWLGDEFGPFLLHVDKTGKLLEPPVELPGEGMHSPDHPTKDPAKARIARSAGFEALMLTPPMSPPWKEHYTLTPVLEKPLSGEALCRLFVYERSEKRYGVGDDGAPEFFHYPIDARAVAVGGCVGNLKAMFVERDDGEGAAAKFKTVKFSGLWAPRDADARPIVLESWTAVDLLNLDDPHDLNRDGAKTFRFPFWTIESVTLVDERTLLVVNDNNYPFSAGRTPGEPDATEFILVRLDREWDEVGREERRARDGD